MAAVEFASYLDDRPLRIGIIGTGYIARHLVLEIVRRESYRLGPILTRTRPAARGDFPGRDQLTRSLQEVVDGSDIVVECTGDALWATQTVEKMLAAGRPVVTFGPEFHVTTGSFFVGKGLLTEAHGDQPGALAVLHQEALGMGFEPLVFGNMKAFLNRDPKPEDMAYWAARQDISVAMVTSFTDGTKLQIEQTLAGNWLGADILQPDMLGPENDDLDQVAKLLAAKAEAHGRPIIDYQLSRKALHGVFITGRHREENRIPLRTYKLGDGPYYTLIQPQILAYLEVFKTLELVRRGQILLDNTAKPGLSVAAVAKHDLRPGCRIESGIGSRELRGVTVRIADEPDHLPIGLAHEVHVRRPVEAGQIVTFDEVDLPASRAVEAWMAIRKTTLQRKTLAPKKRRAATAAA